MSNAIALTTMDETYRMAKALVMSGLMPKAIDTTEKAFAIITLGAELGIAPWAAINGINVIQGKATVSPQLQLALINRSGLMEDMSIEDGETYTAVTMKRRARSAYTFVFTDADAKAMGLLGKENWQKQRPTMRRWRAIGGCARIVFPDVTMNLYSTEEIDPDTVISEDGEVVSVPVSQLAQPPASTPSEPEPQTGIGVDADAPQDAAPQFLSRAESVEVKINGGGKPVYNLILLDKGGAAMKLHTRQELRKLSPFWNEECARWDAPGVYRFADNVGAIDVYAGGRFEIADDAKALHDQPPADGDEDERAEAESIRRGEA